LEASQSRIDELECHALQLENENSHQKSARDKLSEEARHLQEELKHAVQDQQELAGQKKELQREAIEYERRLKSDAALCAGSKHEIERLEAKVDMLNAETSQLKQIEKTLQMRQLELETELTDLHLANAKLSKDLKTKESTLEVRMSDDFL
jgi:chromosome segregation ATPase